MKVRMQDALLSMEWTKLMREKRRRVSWLANAKLPDDAFADDVEDDDTNPYRPNVTWVPSKSVMDM